nr:glutamate-rich protein 6B isoform X3 [Pelodiscus sinensis]|eukprot:XP_025037869.1 glutamate-rich protein 6B isoform X3 [Pelodiscus sinensis]
MCCERWSAEDMSRGHQLSEASSSHPQPRPSPSLSRGVSSDSQSASMRLTVENVKRLEKEYLSVKGVLSNQSIEEYVKQSNLSLLERARSGEVNSRHVPDDENADRATSFLSRDLDKKCRETHLEKTEETSHKGNLLTEFQADSPSTLHVGCKSKESKKSVGGSSASLRRCEVEDLGIQTEWSYSDKTLSAIENAISAVREEKASREDVDGKDSPVYISSQDIVVLFADSYEEIEMKKTEEGSEENKQTKPEDQDSEEITDNLKITTLFLDEEDYIDEEGDYCEFCKSPSKPIPSAEDLDTDPLEIFLCCRTYKEVFECVMRDLMERAFSDEIDIAPHPHLSQSVMESDTRKKLEQKLQERGFDKYRELYNRYMKFCAMTKLSFKISDSSKEGSEESSEIPQTLEDEDTESGTELLKYCHPHEPIRRYYPDGQEFFLLFPDGTGQVFYPSGNIAILIVNVKEVQFIYVILEDDIYSGIRGFFTSWGYATCNYRNGLIWLNLDHHSGSYFDKKGRRQKHWSWNDFSHHVHAPPFQSIFMKLNVYIKIKIVAQDEIYLLFTKNQNCIYFNMVRRLKVKDSTKTEESQLGLLHSKRVQINSLLTKMQTILRDLQSIPLSKIQALPLVVSLLRKLLKWRRKKTPAQ